MTIISALLSADSLRRAALERVAALGLPDCWIGAGFVRDGASAPVGDVDVIWHDPDCSAEERDRRIERTLRDVMPQLTWSVKNQARMHDRNGDLPYASVADAMRYWPETATAVAVRLTHSGSIEVNAPYGLDDLFALRLRPTPLFLTDRLETFTERVAAKRWLQRYPRLAIEITDATTITYTARA